MATKTETFTCNFIGDFKIGDNMQRNAKALSQLVAANGDGAFNKLIVVQAGSIVEAALDQIFYRAKDHTREGVPNIPEAELKVIRSKEISSFNNIIGSMKRHKLLDELGADIYEELHRLRQYRNRVHIQFDDEPDGTPRDEDKAFTTDIVNWSLAFCTRVLRHLTKRFPRPFDLAQYAHAIEIPTECEDRA